MRLIQERLTRDWDIHTVTDEDPLLVGVLVHCIHPSRALVLGGTGEIALLGMLPRVPEVHVLTSTPESMAATYAKARLLEAHGSGIKKVLRRGESAYLQAVENVISDRFHMPSAMHKPTWVQAYRRLSKYWLDASDEALDSARANLRNLTLRQGAFEHVPSRHPVVYANAAYLQRDQRPEHIARLVQQKGYMITSGPRFASAGMQLEMELQHRDRGPNAPRIALYKCSGN